LGGEGKKHIQNCGSVDAATVTDSTPLLATRLSSQVITLPYFIQRCVTSAVTTASKNNNKVAALYISPCISNMWQRSVGHIEVKVGWSVNLAIPTVA
jgi:hypothetical protein